MTPITARRISCLAWHTPVDLARKYDKKEVAIPIRSQKESVDKYAGGQMVDKCKE